MNILKNRGLSILFLLLLSLVTSIKAEAQETSLNAFSPYSFYGIGELRLDGSGYNRMMGGIANAMRDFNALNTVNPAGVSALSQNSFALSVGGSGNSSFLKSAGDKTSATSFNFDYVSFGLPLYKGVAIAFSLTPMSSVGYRVTTRETNPGVIGSIGDVAYNYIGSGSSSQASLSLGAILFKGFSLGIKANYLFGSLKRNYGMTVTPIVTTGGYRDILSEKKLRLNGFNFKVGAQYEISFLTNHTFILGATFQPQLKVGAEYSNFTHAVTGSLSDTIVDSKSKKNNLTLPMMIGGGITYKYSTQWLVGIDYNYVGWQNAKVAGNEALFNNTSEIKVGIQYTPSIYDVRSIFKRISYRAGFRMTQNYFAVNGSVPVTYAITAGVGVPVMKTGTYINAGIELGSRGTEKANLISEKYVGFYLDLNLFFSGGWFQRYEYD